jgi:hypothetical protein
VLPKGLRITTVHLQDQNRPRTAGRDSSTAGRVGGATSVLQMQERDASTSTHQPANVRLFRAKCPGVPRRRYPPLPPPYHHGSALLGLARLGSDQVPNIPQLTSDLGRGGGEEAKPWLGLIVRRRRRQRTLWLSPAVDSEAAGLAPIPTSPLAKIKHRPFARDCENLCSESAVPYFVDR